MSTQAHASGASTDNRSRTVPQRTTGQGSRFLALGLAVVLLVGACGGDQDDDPGSSADDTPARASATPEAGPDDLMAADSTSGIGTPDSVPEALSQTVVLLGDRFDWCSDVETVWNAHGRTTSNLWRSAVDYEEALEAYESATDELDRAEAREALSAAERSYDESLRENQQTLSRSVNQLFDAQRAGGDTPEDIAYRRAWSALVSADPHVADLSSAAVAPLYGSPTTTAAPIDPNAPSPSAIVYAYELAVEYTVDFDYLGDRERNRAAEEAAYAVYSQVDSAVVAESLQAAAYRAVQDVRSVRMVGPARPSYQAKAALDVLKVAGGVPLMPHDAEAYDAAFSAGTSNVHQGDDYLYFVGSADQEYPPSDDEAFLSAYAARLKVIYEALPETLELVSTTIARQDTEAQAEESRQREEAAHQQAAIEALTAALGELVQGSDAYIVFKLSFEESCR